MMNRHRLLVVLTTLVLTIGIAPFAAAWAGQQPAPAPAPAALSAQGELMSVDTDSKKLTIKASDGTLMDFFYNDETEVTGAQEGPAGLATKSGSQVTVHFKQEGTARLAKKIEVNATSK
jgi:hypothetical protein